ncbi:MAG: hypothetical protein FJ222_12210 [Lentisphaerae bacterium]|nr:hypothetical protein [Lentisphaerota bacterium]
MAYADVWSNESVQNIKLLGGMAPTCYMEQLVYDCRLLNQATEAGQPRLLRDWLVASDARLDPQAFILAPDNVIALSRTLVGAPDDYAAGKAVALKAVELLRSGREAGRVKIEEKEAGFLDAIEAAVESMPAEEGRFIEEMIAEAPAEKWLPREYGL